MRPPGTPRPSFVLAARDPAGAVALAVVEQALVDAEHGDSAAHAWVAQLRADILEHAPRYLVRRVGEPVG